LVVLATTVDNHRKRDHSRDTALHIQFNELTDPTCGLYR